MVSLETVPTFDYKIDLFLKILDYRVLLVSGLERKILLPFFRSALETLHVLIFLSYSFLLWIMSKPKAVSFPNYVSEKSLSFSPSLFKSYSTISSSIPYVRFKGWDSIILWFLWGCWYLSFWYRDSLTTLSTSYLYFSKLLDWCNRDRCWAPSNWLFGRENLRNLALVWFRE